MKSSKLIRWCLPGLAALLLGACSQPKPEPEIASSAPHALYAESYPQQVDAEIAGFGESQAEVKELAGGFSKYPDELKEPVDHHKVAEMVERADQVGRSHTYVETLRDVQAARRFFEDEKDEIGKKVSGAAQYMAKQKGCEAEVGPAAINAMNKAVKERLEERLRDGNDAHRLLERHREALGKENAETLERQLDEVSLASYLAYIAIVEHKVRLRRMMEESEQVTKTLDETIEAERSFQSDSGRSDEEKKAASERIESLQKAKVAMQAAVDKAKRTSEALEQRIEQTQKQYREALDKLLADLRSRPKG